MMKMTALIAALLIGSSAAVAQGGTVLTLPTIQPNPSQGASCSSAPPSNLATPIAANTVMFNCVVFPASWTGTVTGPLASPFAVGPVTGNTFTIIVTSAVAAGTVLPAPGTVNINP